MDPQNTTLVTRQDAQLGFLGSIDNLVGTVGAMARANIAELLRTETRAFGQLQIQAMEKIEALRLVGALDLAGILARWQLIQEIRAGNFLATHPGGYADLDDMARQNNISVTELHNIIKVGEIIFPWITAHYGANGIADLWDELGKSRFFELVPLLTSTITGTVSGSSKVRNAINAALDVAAVNAGAENLIFTDLPVEEQRNRVTREIIEIGRGTQSVLELRQALRGQGTENLLFLQYQPEGGPLIVTSRLSQDQFVMLRRLLGDHLEVVDLNRTDPHNDQVARLMLPLIDLVERARVRLGDQDPQVGEDEF